jgi:2-polyprenyl-3-methyl-5-hydroxy-6-metoxy-1,4-benzoquinol methylase
VLGTSLSEFHSGYRVYAVAALRRIPFLLNSNDFEFDTEIIIQLLNLEARILELPIPTYYGDEISRVNGLRYAKNVVLATLRNAAHRAGIYYRRRYDVETGNSHYGAKIGYASSHTFAIDAVPTGSKVIDLGGGAGFIAAALADKGCDVHLVDQHPAAVGHARVTSETRDLDGGPPPSTQGFDHVLLLDVIEHMSNPEKFLESLRAGFDHDPKVLVLSTPNVAFIVQRLQLLLGQFNYGKAGILDITHKRLFTFRGIRQLLEDSGFYSLEVKGVPAPFPKVLGEGILAQAALAANQTLIKLSKTLFSYQIFVVARGTPAIDFLLEEARSSERARKTPS